MSIVTISLKFKTNLTNYVNLNNFEPILHILNQIISIITIS
jgi:hypothetical protein